MLLSEVWVRKLSHASLEIGGWGSTLVTDPWFSGSAFADSWALADEPVVDAYQALSQCSYLWVSHGHPDHFSPPTLLTIPQHQRSVMKVLVIDTIPNRVLIQWFERHGFQVVRLRHRQRTELEPGVVVECGEVHFGDSWLWSSFHGATVLNLNDCVLQRSDLRYLENSFQGVDILALQYGVANWTGNAEDESVRKAAADSVLDRVDHSVTVIQPRITIPFASEFWFCHEENAHLNGSQNSSDDVVRRLESRSQPTAMLKNGDQVDVQQHVNRSQQAVSPLRTAIRSQGSLELGALRALCASRARDTNAYHGRIRMWLYRNVVGRMSLGRVIVRLVDTGEIISVSTSGVVRASEYRSLDIEMSSEMLAEVVGKPYGLDNLFIGGRFRRESQRALLRLGMVFGPDRLRSMGLHMGPSLLMHPRLLLSLVERVASGRWTKRSQ